MTKKPDITNFPNININTGTWGSVSIEKNGSVFQLKHNDAIWHGYNTKNKREIYQQWSSYDLAYGDVLISGFGFGQIALWLASKPSVKTVTVIEISQDVIDAFLSSNTIPDNVSIIIADMNSYITDKKYDCIIFDHFNFIKTEDFYKELCKVAKSIPHDLFWFWSIEEYYIMNYYNITFSNLFINPIDFNQFDFSLKWKDMISDLEMNSIPLLDKSKITSYIDIYFLRHLLSTQNY